MDDKIIKKLNDAVLGCSAEQGIFFQPYGVPPKIKEHVIYSRYSSGGYSGGNCWDGIAEPYERDKPKDHLKILDLFLEEFYPNITFLQYNKIKDIIHNNSETEHEYYGNSTDWVIEYIIISELEKLLVGNK